MGYNVSHFQKRALGLAASEVVPAASAVMPAASAVVPAASATVPAASEAVPTLMFTVAAPLEVRAQIVTAELIVALKNDILIFSSLSRS